MRSAANGESILRWPLRSVNHPTLLFYRNLMGSPTHETSPSLPDLIAHANSFYGQNGKLATEVGKRQSAQMRSLRDVGWTLFAFDAVVAWRLVPGSAHGRIWNASLRLHDLYGLPYLPGSTVKGAFRAFAEMRGHQEIGGLCGEVEKRSSLVFFDMFPEIGTIPLLATDVLTKHHKGYYESSDAEIPPPADWDTPEPVGFFTLRRDVKLRFLAALAPATAQPTLAEVFRRFLESGGLGAKTGKGYGRLRATRISL